MADVRFTRTHHTEAMSTAVTELSNMSQALVELVEKTSAGVVAVKSAPHRVTSGVAFRDDLIAVANHSLRREERISVQTDKGEQAIATVLGRDPSVDLAFLRVEGLHLTPLPLRNPASAKAGMLAAVVGLTIDAGASASLGVLGAVGGPRRSWRGGTLDEFLRLDVNLYPSQSGAAVVDSEGALIGMATPALLRHSAVALPPSTLNRVADELLKEGRIRRGYLGVGMQPVAIPPALQQEIQQQSESGLMILSVESESPAEKADWRLGDILVLLDGKPVTEIEELQTILRGDNVGQILSALLIRGGQKIDSQITVGERRPKGK